MFRSFTLVVIALLLSGAPLVHQHPLEGVSTGNSASAPCVVCATSVTKLPQLSPAIDAPRVVVYDLDATVQLVVTSAGSSSTPSRAPPAL